MVSGATAKEQADCSDAKLKLYMTSMPGDTLTPSVLAAQVLCKRNSGGSGIATRATAKNCWHALLSFLTEQVDKDP